jgi:hypothetical protein
MTPRVFLCEPSGLSAEQRVLSDRWHERLFGLGFDVDQLGSNEYERDPWSVLLRRIGASDGVLVLGFSQLVVSAATWRANTDQERQVTPTWTTSWLHLEAGMALAAGLPLLVAAGSGVAEGVFESAVWIGAVRGTALEDPDTCVIDRWVAEVIARSAAPAFAHPLDS